MDLCITCNCNPNPFRFSQNQGTKRFGRKGLNFRCELRTVESNPMASPSSSTSIPTHRVTVHDRLRGVVHEFLVPEGYALLCVGFPSSDVEVETQDEDEVYWLQFGRYFARGPIERDDYALELAMGDE